MKAAHASFFASSQYGCAAALHANQHRNVEGSRSRVLDVGGMPLVATYEHSEVLFECPGKGRQPDCSLTACRIHGHLFE